MVGQQSTEQRDAVGMYFKHIVEVDNYKNIRNANGAEREGEPCKNR